MSPRAILIAFGVALLVVFSGVAWISTTALGLEQAELDARRQAALEDTVRLALWRMDTALLPLIARENARSEFEPGAAPPEHVHQLFDLAPSGTLGDLQAAEVFAALPETATATSPIAFTDRSSSEWQLRSANLENCREAVGAGAAPLNAIWVRGELLLARRTGEHAQGVWLDWAELQRWLPGTVADLLPNARVEPAGLHDARQRRLAALPVRLIPGDVSIAAEPQRSSIRMVLGVAWAGLLLAATAVIALLIGTLSLSERRATFVSAVTHELRTPMTTLQTYAEMLVDGKITDADKRQRYLQTLHREAVRLAHLINNVLAYSGLERGRRTTRVEALQVGPLLERMKERLAARVTESGMSLTIEVADGLVLSGDAGPIEQIVFNLVDNAAKYGAGRVSIAAVARGAKVELRVRDEGKGVAVEVRGRLFEPFSKSAELAAGGQPGVGLGLSLSRSLARAMGGELRLEPGEGGACFVLTLRRLSE